MLAPWSQVRFTCTSTGKPIGVGGRGATSSPLGELSLQRHDVKISELFPINYKPVVLFSYSVHKRASREPTHFNCAKCRTDCPKNHKNTLKRLGPICVSLPCTRKPKSNKTKHRRFPNKKLAIFSSKEGLCTNHRFRCKERECQEDILGVQRKLLCSCSRF